MEEQVETIESKEVIKQEAAVKIQSMFRGFKVNRERRFIVLSHFYLVRFYKLNLHARHIFSQAREEVKHIKEAKEQQEVPTFEADTTFDISDISTDTEVTAHLPGDDHPQDTQVCSLLPIQWVIIQPSVLIILFSKYMYSSFKIYISLYIICYLQY